MILGLQFVITMSLVIWNKQDMGVTITEVSQYDEDRVVYVRMAWRATAGRVIKWVMYWMLLIVPSVVLLIQESGWQNFNEMETANVKQWWKYAVI